MRPSSTAVILLSVAALGWTAYGWADESPWHTEPFSASPQDLLAAAELLEPVEEDGRFIVQRRRLVLGDDGGSTEYVHQIYQPLTEAGLGAVSNLIVPWSPWRQERPEVRARVITPAGSEHWLDQGTIGEFPVQQFEPNVLHDLRQLQAPMPRVAIGAVIEVESVFRKR